jgi:hypothetical protein
MENMNFTSEHMTEMDQVIQIYYKAIDEAKEARNEELNKQYVGLKYKLLELLDFIDDSIDAAYDKIEQAAREKCENDIIKIREKHYKREG